MVDIDPRLASELLEALALAGIAAYVTPAVGSMGMFLNRSYPRRPLHSLYVDADQEPGAKEIIDPLLATSVADDEAAAFEAIVAGFDETQDLPPRAPAETVFDPEDSSGSTLSPGSFDTPRAWGPRDFEPEPEDEHYVPPPPSPRPPLHTTTKWAIVSLLAGLLLLVAPSLIGVEGGDGTLFVAVLAILLGAGLLISRLRDTDPGDETDDDGAVV